MSSDLTKPSAITWQSIVLKLLRRTDTWVQEVNPIHLWKTKFYSFKNDKMGECHLHCVRGIDGIASGIALHLLHEEFIRKEGLTLKQRTSTRIVRNRQEDLTR